MSLARDLLVAEDFPVSASGEFTFKVHFKRGPHSIIKRRMGPAGKTLFKHNLDVTSLKGEDYPFSRRCPSAQTVEGGLSSVVVPRLTVQEAYRDWRAFFTLLPAGSL